MSDTPQENRESKLSELRDFVKNLKFKSLSINVGFAKVTLEKAEKDASRNGPIAPHTEPTEQVILGRAKELSLLEDQIKDGRKIFWLSGAEGIGKTSLALTLATKLCKSKNGYDGNPVIIDLKGSSKKQLLTIDNIRTKVINDLQPQTYLQNNPDLLKQSYNNTLSGRKIVIVLDNALDVQQVSELFSYDGKSKFLMIVTSRSRLETGMGYLAHNDVFPLEILGLDSADAKSLLLSMVGLSDSNLSELSKLCKNIPLAILWAGKFIKNRINHQDHSIYIGTIKSKIAVSSRAGYGTTGSIASIILSVNYEYLKKEEQDYWLDLAVFRGTFDEEILGPVWRETNKNTVKNIVQMFNSLSLVNYDSAFNRYSLHDLAHTFVRSNKNTLRHEENRVIFSTYFLGILKKLNDEYIFGRGNKFKKSRKLFDLEWNNIRDGYYIAKKICNENNADYSNLCISYPIEGFDILSLRQNPDDRLDWIEYALTKTRSEKEEERKGILQDLKALALRHKGGKTDVEAAIGLLDSAIEIAEKYDSDRWKAIHLNNKGNTYAVLGDFEEAILSYNAALEIIDKDDPVGNAIVLNNLTRAYINLGETPKAFTLSQEALRIACNARDLRREAGAYSNMGIIHRHFGNAKESILQHKKALRIFSDLGDRLWVGITLCLFGRALMDQGTMEIEYGIEETEDAGKIFRDFGERRWEGIAIGNLGAAKIKLGAYDEAKQLINSALKISNATGDNRRSAIHQNCLGRAHLKSDEVDEAIACHELALGKAKFVKDKRRQSGAHLWLGISQYIAGSDFEADGNLKKSLALSKENHDRRKQAQAKRYRGLIKDRNGNPTKAKKYLAEALKISKEIDAPFKSSIEKELRSI